MAMESEICIFQRKSESEKRSLKRLPLCPRKSRPVFQAFGKAFSLLLLRRTIRTSTFLSSVLFQFGLHAYGNTDGGNCFAFQIKSKSRLLRNKRFFWGKYSHIVLFGSCKTTFLICNINRAGNIFFKVCNFATVSDFYDTW